MILGIHGLSVLRSTVLSTGVFRPDASAFADYIINGHMIGGFALVAWPAEWGNTGVMTFIVNQQGKIFEKNLGLKTPSIVGAMTTYEPDTTWTLATKP